MIRPLLRVGFGFVFHPPEFFVSGPIREQTQLGLTYGHPYLLTCPQYHTTLTAKKKKKSVYSPKNVAIDQFGL